jgi:hypothetical protein
LTEPLEGERPSEEELRARLEEELKKVSVADVLLQTVVTLINIGGQRLSLSDAAPDARDLEQVRLAIESVRALLPLLEATEGGAAQMRPIRDALSQLQLAYAREVGAAEGTGAEQAGVEAGAGQTARAEQDQPTERGTGGLWVPPGSAL